MRVTSMLFSAAIVMASAAVLSGVPAQAQQDRPTREGARLHELCEKGDQRACVRFGMVLNENRGRHEEWRKSHPEFWSYQGGAPARAAGAAGGGGTNMPWCGVPYASTRECVYQSIGACENDMRPLGGDCVPRD
jgi:hypothetical protein